MVDAQMGALSPPERNRRRELSLAPLPRLQNGVQATVASAGSPFHEAAYPRKGTVPLFRRGAILSVRLRTHS